MRRQRAAILLRSSESVGWAVSAFNMRGRWGLRLRPSPGAPIKRILRKDSGAHHYIDSGSSDPATALQALGGAQIVLVTASSGKVVSETFKGLRPNGVSIVLGVGPEPIEVSTMDLIFGSRKLEGALTGNPATGDETLRFSALAGIAAMIETAPLEKPQRPTRG